MLIKQMSFNIQETTSSNFKQCCKDTFLHSASLPHCQPPKLTFKILFPCHRLSWQDNLWFFIWNIALLFAIKFISLRWVRRKMPYSATSISLIPGDSALTIAWFKWSVPIWHGDVKICNRNFKMGPSGERMEMSACGCSRMHGRSGGGRTACVDST